MRKDGAERRTELLRKLVHVGSGFIAIALAWLTWQQALGLAVAALVFNALILPRIGGKALHRAEDLRRGHAFGIIMYPLSVVILTLVFRERLEFVAIGWALMAFGDGMASVIGSLVGRHRLPWNEAKSWEGVLAHVVFGSAAAMCIGSFVAHGHGLDVDPVTFAIAISVATLVTAIVESIESGVDDNILVPLLGAGLAFVVVSVGAPLSLSLLISLEVSPLADERLVQRLMVSAGLCAALALIAWWRGKLTVLGAIGAAILGVVVATAGGWGLFAALCAFFAVGVDATRIGRSVKEARGIAETRGGRRGLGNVIANGGMAGLLAIMTFEPGLHVSGHLAAMLCGVAALATSAFDTVSSEIGKAHGRRTFLPTTLRSVPPGTEGAISLEGTLAGALGALLVALPALLIAFNTMYWPTHDPGARLARLGGLIVVSALIGSMFESVIGALCHDRQHRVQNDFMNFANTVVGATAMAVLLHCVTNPGEQP